MNRILAFFTLALLLAFTLPFSTPATAQDAESKANAAVSAILFEEDADEFTSFRIDGKGFLNVTFASNTPDEVYSRILNKLQNHPDIRGVLAGKGGPACRRF